MPYLRFSRDKRGYEYFSIVEPGAVRRGRTARPRVLFWFRTPPQVKVGRLPFTDEIRRAIEAQNPGLRFDWPRLLATPIPPPDADHWRERRRAEKAARQAAREAEQPEHAERAGQEAGEPSAPESESDAPLAVEGSELAGIELEPAGSGEAAETVETAEAQADDGEETAAALPASESEESAAAPPAAGGDSPGSGRRRRRRRRRRRPTAGAAPEQAAPGAPAPPSEEV